jgi:Ser/Thr protein kinase RdoA (MazF antagonist)
MSFCLAETLWDIYESTGDVTLMTGYVEAYETVRQMTSSEHKILPDMVRLRGWIALHGSLLTQGPEAAASLMRQDMVAELNEHTFRI